MFLLNFVGVVYFFSGLVLFFFKLVSEGGFYFPIFSFLAVLGDLFSSSFLALFFVFDYYSFVYLFVLFFIVSSIHFFRVSYMSLDLSLARFTVILKLFVFSMSFLIVSGKFISFIYGWDWLGLTSFLLVVWYGCRVSRYAGLKTFLVNRLGDAFFLSSIAVSLYWSDFRGFFSENLNWLVVVSFVLGAFTKSAQFPFRSWLPEAMAAPTPISALVHSSTLVTAGLFFLFRFRDLVPFDSLFFVYFVGVFTVYLGSLGACVDKNSKKVVAYSTISQLGFIIFCQGSEFEYLAFGYMMLHAFVKALLFLSVGSYMLYISHCQDSRSMYSNLGVNPFFNLSFLFCVYVLAGLSFRPIHLFKLQLLKMSFLFSYFKLFIIFVVFCSSLLTIYYCTLLYSDLIFSRHSVSPKYSCLFSSSSFLYLFILFIGMYLLSFMFYSFTFCFRLYLKTFFLCVILFILPTSSLLARFYWFPFYSFFMFFLLFFISSFNKFFRIGFYLHTVVDRGLLPFSFLGLDYFVSKVFIDLVGKIFFLSWVLYIFSFGMVFYFLFFSLF